MKNLLTVIVLFWHVFTAPALYAQAVPAKGYQLTVAINAYRGQYLYLGYHYGKIKALADSALVKPNGKAVFSGAALLPGGIYFMVSPKKEILYELLLDKQQEFSMAADSARMGQVQFTGSSENIDFQNYTKFVSEKGGALNAQQGLLAKAQNKADSTAIQEKAKVLNTEILSYRSDFIQKKPNSFLATLFAALQEPQVPAAAKQPKGV